jgi:hypothetical protein
LLNALDAASCSTHSLSFSGSEMFIVAIVSLHGLWQSLP